MKSETTLTELRTGPPTTISREDLNRLLSQMAPRHFEVEQCSELAFLAPASSAAAEVNGQQK